MSASDAAGHLGSLLRMLRPKYPGATEPEAPVALLDPAEPILAEFFRSFLLWESTSQRSFAAIKRFEEAVVDFNELRVCLPDELIGVMGERYPRAEERALRLKTALHGIYVREHAVTLEPLSNRGKRECKEYLESLDGVPRFVASRVQLLCLGAHAAPMDGRLLRRLQEAQVADQRASIDDVAALLERKVRAGEMLETYSLLQAWSDEQPLSLDAEVKPVRTRRSGSVGGASARSGAGTAGQGVGAKGKGKRKAD